MSSVSARHAGHGLSRCLKASRISPSNFATAGCSRHASSTPRAQAVAAPAWRATSTTTPVRRATTTVSSTTTAPDSQPPSTTRNAAVAPRPPTTTNANGTSASPTRDLEDGLSDNPLDLPTNSSSSTEPDWSRSFHGLSSTPFSAEAAAALLEPLSAEDIEVKPDGIIYLPEIKYRRILNRAFGPGGWGLAPRGETIVTGKSVTREYGLVAGGRLVSVSRGEQQYFDPEGIPTATEGCKSNALMRCCKDLGVASELWDPRFIRRFLKDHAKKVWVEHVVSKKKKQITIRKDDEVQYPWKESKFASASGAF